MNDVIANVTSLQDLRLTDIHGGWDVYAISREYR